MLMSFKWYVHNKDMVESIIKAQLMHSSLIIVCLVFALQLPENTLYRGNSTYGKDNFYHGKE